VRQRNGARPADERCGFRQRSESHESYAQETRIHRRRRPRRASRFDKRNRRSETICSTGCVTERQLHHAGITLDVGTMGARDRGRRPELVLGRGNGLRCVSKSAQPNENRCALRFEISSLRPSVGSGARQVDCRIE
jgi:hypothetical protein